LIPSLGGLIAGIMIKYGSTKIIGHGIPEAIESVLLSKSKIEPKVEPKVGILKALSATITFLGRFRYSWRVWFGMRMIPYVPYLI
jgi:H+/Cl- antiporter ClcA